MSPEIDARTETVWAHVSRELDQNSVFRYRISGRGFLASRRTYKDVIRVQQQEYITSDTLSAKTTVVGGRIDHVSLIQNLFPDLGSVVCCGTKASHAKLNGVSERLKDLGIAKVHCELERVDVGGQVYFAVEDSSRTVRGDYYACLYDSLVDPDEVKAAMYCADSQAYREARPVFIVLAHKATPQAIGVLAQRDCVERIIVGELQC